MLSMRVTDVFDANVMDRIAGVKGREFDWWGISVVDCQLGKAVNAFADFGRLRERI
jgi:hypothetical protein